MRKSKMKIARTVRTDPQTLLLSGLLILFIAFDIKIPREIANVIDNIFGKVVIIFIGLYLLAKNLMVGVLFIIAGVELMRRSSNSTGRAQIKKYIPSENKKYREMKLMNKLPVTLEEEVIHNRIPINKTSYGDSSFKPVQEKIHDAAQLK